MWLRSLVIVTGALMIVYSTQFGMGENAFTSTSASFPATDLGTRFSDPFVDKENDAGEIVISNASQLNQGFATTYFETLVWTLNAAMGIVVLIAGLTEIKPLGLISAVWMIIFAVSQMAIASSFTAIICGENELPVECIPAGGYFAGSKAITAICVIYYFLVGGATGYWASKLDGSASASKLNFNISRISTLTKKKPASPPPQQPNNNVYMQGGSTVAQPQQIYVHQVPAAGQTVQPIGTGEPMVLQPSATGQPMVLHPVGTGTGHSVQPIHTGQSVQSVPTGQSVQQVPTGQSTQG